METSKLLISGKVQGVYYRESAKQMAMNLGINGFVKNESDGSVSMEIEGESAAISEMVEWCKSGPGLARVSNVEIVKETPRNYVSFDIKR